MTCRINGTYRQIFAGQVRSVAYEKSCPAGRSPAKTEAAADLRRESQLSRRNETKAEQRNDKRHQPSLRNYGLTGRRLAPATFVRPHGLKTNHRS
jgi:hypothetical protein